MKRAIDQRAKNKRRYGLTGAEHAQLRIAQNDVCAICRQPERGMLRGKLKQLAIDHCHTTGRVRGLLCANCNGMIGMSGDSPSILRAAADYLEKAGQ